MTVGRWDGELPVPGDFLRTRAGSCYRIDEVRPGRVKRVGSLRCTRLEHDAVAEGDDGVWMWYWNPRVRTLPR
jgi:hypothetical protein